MSELNARLDLPLGDGAAAVARRAVAAVLAGWGFDDDAWIFDAVLVVDELVSNAVKHGGGCLELGLEAHEGTVTVGAADGSAVVPRRGDPTDKGGRGLALVEAISSRWGVSDHEGGKRVWVELRPYLLPGAGKPPT